MLYHLKRNKLIKRREENSILFWLYFLSQRRLFGKARTVNNVVLFASIASKKTGWKQNSNKLADW